MPQKLCSFLRVAVQTIQFSRRSGTTEAPLCDAIVTVMNKRKAKPIKIRFDIYGINLVALEESEEDEMQNRFLRLQKWHLAQSARMQGNEILIPVK